MPRTSIIASVLVALMVGFSGQGVALSHAPSAPSLPDLGGEDPVPDENETVEFSSDGALVSGGFALTFAPEQRVDVNVTAEANASTTGNEVADRAIENASDALGVNVQEGLEPVTASAETSIGLPG